MKNLLVVLTISIFFLGCSVKQNYFTSQISKDVELSQDDVTILVNDFSNFIDNYYLPAKTKFYIQTNNADSVFLKTIDQNLRAKGYAIAFVDDSEDINYLSWHISKLNNKILRATYNINTSRITRMYEENEDNESIKPYGSFSAINLKKENISISFQGYDFEKTEKKTTVAPLTATIKARVLRIRAQPSLDADVIGGLVQGSEVKIAYINRDSGYPWAKLFNQDGYISNKKAYVKYEELSDEQ